MFVNELRHRLSEDIEYFEDNVAALGDGVLQIGRWIERIRIVLRKLERLWHTSRRSFNIRQ